MLRGSGGEGLERSCGAGDWVRSRGPIAGVELLRARFSGRAFARHRHDTYAIGVTEAGVQTFDYRGRVESSRPGQVVVLHPDEAHDGRAGAEGGFGYRIVYVEPARIAAAVRAIRGRPAPLPFVREPVSTDPRLSRAIDAAFRAPLDSLAVDGLVVEIAHVLLAKERGAGVVARRVDGRAVERARQFLDAERTRAVHSAELEALTGLTRYELARQFRAAYGTSPYRYSLMRRLDAARNQLRGGMRLVDAALATGFADQAHFTRTFRAAYGITPGRFTRLHATPQQ
jgi:AraC-like DNA-binding protein